MLEKPMHAYSDRPREDVTHVHWCRELHDYCEGSLGMWETSLGMWEMSLGMCSLGMCF